MNDLNPIPAPWASGQFDAISPFDIIVDKKVYYTTEAVRTIPEMQAAKVDLYKLVFQPVGISKDDSLIFINELLEAKAVIVTLTAKNNNTIHIPSTFLKSFPLVNGTVLEQFAIIAYLGACPPDLKNKVLDTIDHINDYIKHQLGVNPQTQLATLPTKSFISKEQAVAWEKTRQESITNHDSDIARIVQLEEEIRRKDAYILQLENMKKVQSK